MSDSPMLFIDMDQLAFAWEDPTSDSAYYLDLETGSVIMIHPDLHDAGELKGEVEIEPDRYLLVPKPKENQVELDLIDFICTIPDLTLRSQLEVAIESPRRFMACQELLSAHPEQLHKWEQWRRESGRTRAHRWLEAHGIKSLS